tara:strand:+ start:826 stop:1008 length:183 start_codon:yes stop_codon:yes gene_type:complete
MIANIDNGIYDLYLAHLFYRYPILEPLRDSDGRRRILETRHLSKIEKKSGAHLFEISANT